MKANELMIHNYVSFEGHPVYVMYIGLTYIEGLLCKNNTLYDVKLKHEDIEPIPITEKLLMKNGFMKIRGGLLPTCYYKKVGDCFAEIEFDCSSMGKDYVICHIKNFKGSSFVQVDILYIHQLQNLCNIAGVELQLNIDKI